MDQHIIGAAPKEDLDYEPVTPKIKHSKTFLAPKHFLCDNDNNKCQVRKKKIIEFLSKKGYMILDPKGYKTNAYQ